MAEREGTALTIGTRKGAWILSSDPARDSWSATGPHFLGHIVPHAVLDPRDGRTLLLAMRTGHPGPTVFRSTDLGASWQEATSPPAFAAGDTWAPVSGWNDRPMWETWCEWPEENTPDGRTAVCVTSEQSVVDEQGRLRKHLKAFVNQDSTRHLDRSVDRGDEVVIMQALSGG